jgi:hypothetical protein
MASLLKEFGLRATLYGGNPYRAKAYLRTADSVALLTEPIGDLVKQNRPPTGIDQSKRHADLARHGSRPLRR